MDDRVRMPKAGLLKFFLLQVMLILTGQTLLFSHNTEPKHKHKKEDATHQGENYIPIASLPLNITHLTTRDGLPSNQALDFTEDPYGQIWINTQNGLCIFNGQEIMQPLNEEVPRNIRHHMIDDQGRFWGAYNTGLFCYDGQKVIDLPFPRELQPHTVLGTNIFLLGDSTILLGHSGLVIRDDTYVPLRKLDPRAPDLSGKIVYLNEALQLFLVRDSAGNNNDFYTLDWEACDATVPDNISDYLGRYLTFFSAYNAVGFNCLNIPVKSAALPLMVPNDDCRGFQEILDSKNGHPVPLSEQSPDLVVSYSEGDRKALCYLKKGGHYEPFWVGVPNSTRRMFMSSNGDIYFSSDKGVHILHPDEALRQRITGKGRMRPPRLLIRSIAGQPVPFHERDNTSFRWHEKELTLDVCLVDMAGTLPVTQYRVNEGDWIDFSCEKPLRLDGMDHGMNRIELRVLTDKESTPASYSIVKAAVELPVLERSEVRTLALICGVILVILIVWTLYQRITMRKELKKLRQNLYETQLSTIQSQLNPHFLFNAMISLQNTIKNRTKEEASEHLDQMSKLIREVMELSQKRSSRSELNERFIPLEKELQLLKDYVKLENRQREPKFDFHFHVDPGIDKKGVQVPPLMIQPFVENAIIHGIPDVADGAISVDIEQKDSGISYTVKDNGVGLEAGTEQKRKRFSEFKSHGGTILRQRIQLLRSLGYPIELKISEGKPRGTVVQINLPTQL